MSPRQLAAIGVFTTGPLMAGLAGLGVGGAEDGYGAADF
jgi:hypothetical protein